MGSVQPPPPVKLFTGLLIWGELALADVEAALVAALGPVDHRTPRMPFEFTDYYAREMGEILDRVFFSFEDLIDASELAPIKVRTNAIEDEFRRDTEPVKRPVNIDPGYIEQSKVVLASTKNFYHRVYLGHGVFGETTMHFRNNTYQFFPWTYPDYQSRDYQEFFQRMRQIYRTQLRRMCRNRES